MEYLFGLIGFALGVTIGVVGKEQILKIIPLVKAIFAKFKKKD